MIGSGNAGEMFDPGPLSTADFAAGSICHFLGRDLEKLKLFIVEARKAGAIISCNANGADCRPILPYVDYAFMNEDELKRSVNTSDPFAAVEAAARQSSSHAVITRGRSGAVLLGGREQVWREAFVVEPVDRTGGGDCCQSSATHTPAFVVMFRDNSNRMVRPDPDNPSLYISQLSSKESFSLGDYLFEDYRLPS